MPTYNEMQRDCSERLVSFAKHAKLSYRMAHLNPSGHANEFAHESFIALASFLTNECIPLEIHKSQINSFQPLADNIREHAEKIGAILDRCVGRGDGNIDRRRTAMQAASSRAGAVVYEADLQMAFDDIKRARGDGRVTRLHPEPTRENVGDLLAAIHDIDKAVWERAKGMSTLFADDRVDNVSAFYSSGRIKEEANRLNEVLRRGTSGEQRGGGSLASMTEYAGSPRTSSESTSSDSDRGNVESSRSSGYESDRRSRVGSDDSMPPLSRDASSVSTSENHSYFSDDVEQPFIRSDATPSSTGSRSPFPGREGLHHPLDDYSEQLPLGRIQIGSEPSSPGDASASSYSSGYSASNEAGSPASHRSNRYETPHELSGDETLIEQPERSPSRGSSSTRDNPNLAPSPYEANADFLRFLEQWPGLGQVTALSAFNSEDPQAALEQARQTYGVSRSPSSSPGVIPTRERSPSEGSVRSLRRASAPEQPPGVIRETAPSSSVEASAPLPQQEGPEQVGKRQRSRSSEEDDSNKRTRLDERRERSPSGGLER